MIEFMRTVSVLDWGLGFWVIAILAICALVAIAETITGSARRRAEALKMHARADLMRAQTQSALMDRGTFDPVPTPAAPTLATKAPVTVSTRKE